MRSYYAGPVSRYHWRVLGFRNVFGRRVWTVPRWWAFLFGGTHGCHSGGFGWRPSLWRLTLRWWREGWYRRPGRTGWAGWWDFVALDGHHPEAWAAHLEE